ncbi:MAG: DUF2490 domain-containing protein [Bacteroidota bacterium]
MIFSATFAQAPSKSIHNRTQTWLGYFNQTRFSDKWGMWVDVHYRMTDNFADRPFQFLFRPAVTYFIKDNLRVNVGYTLAEHFPAKGLNTTRTEHRAWQQVWWNQKYSRMSTLQWLRLEQRFNQKVANDVKVGGYTYTFRARYNFAFFIPLKGRELAPKTPFVAIMNEVFLNFGKNVVYNTFDQNRLFVGLGYQFTTHLNAQLGYMNVYQQDATGNNYFSSHCIRFFVFHSLDLRKKADVQ